MENTVVNEVIDTVAYPVVDVKAEQTQLKALLAEARNTKIVLEDFEAAVMSGIYTGSRMLAVAKGLAFLDAILNQNKAHIKNLQERTGE